MTHHSSYRYGAAILDQPSKGKSSEVRIGYFDPVTGEPCATKPKPLDRKAEPRKSAHERYAQRKADEAEAADIMRNMKKRKEAAAKESKRERDKGRKRASKQPAPKKPAQERRSRVGHPGKPVLVDGTVFPSVTAAAEHIGTSNAHLCKQLLAGASKVKGRSVSFAKVTE